MKIAFFHELDVKSGAKRVVEEYGSILGKDNDVDLYYVSEKKDVSADRIFNKSFFFPFHEKKWKKGDWKAKLYKDSVEFVKLFGLHRRIAKLVNSKNYDFVLVNPSKYTQAPFILRFLKHKKIYFAQEPLRIVYDSAVYGQDSISFYERINRIKRKLLDSANLEFAQVILCNSEFSRKNILKAYGKKAFVCYLGVNTKIFKPMKTKKTNDLLFLGEKTTLEGFDLIEQTLSLFKIKPNIKFLADVERKLSDKDLAKEYNKSRLTLVLSRNEPFGLIPIESMACGVPVVALDEGGFKESVVNGKTGYLVKADPDDIKRKIEKLLSNDKLREKLGSNGVDYVNEKFTWGKSASVFNTLIK